MKNQAAIVLAFAVLASIGLTSTKQAAISLADEPQLSSEISYGYIYRDKKSGRCFLKANLSLLKRTMRFTVLELWGYAPEERKWKWMPLDAIKERTIAPEQKQVYSRTTDPIVQPITDSRGLFWLKWREDDKLFGSLFFSGMLCNDVRIGPERKGDSIATCIPGRESATAAYVPDPTIYCKKRKEGFKKDK